MKRSFSETRIVNPKSKTQQTNDSIKTNGFYTQNNTNTQAKSTNRVPQPHQTQPLQGRPPLHAQHVPHQTQPTSGKPLPRKPQQPAGQTQPLPRKPQSQARQAYQPPLEKERPLNHVKVLQPLRPPKPSNALKTNSGIMIINSNHEAFTPEQGQNVTPIFHKQQAHTSHSHNSSTPKMTTQRQFFFKSTSEPLKKRVIIEPTEKVCKLI